MIYKMVSEYGNVIQYTGSESKKRELIQLGYREVSEAGAKTKNLTKKVKKNDKENSDRA